MTERLMALIEAYERQAAVSDSAADYAADYGQLGMEPVYSTEAATLRRVARELRRELET